MVIYYLALWQQIQTANPNEIKLVVRVKYVAGWGQKYKTARSRPVALFLLLMLDTETAAEQIIIRNKMKTIIRGTIKKNCFFLLLFKKLRPPPSPFFDHLSFF